MKLKVLGSRSPFACYSQNCPGFLVTDGNYKIMLDCGSGITRQLMFPEDLKNLHIFISHFHRDHYNEIYNIQYASYVFNRQGKLTTPIDVHLPVISSSYFEDIVSEEYAFANYNRIIDELQGVQLGGLKITFCLTGHTTESYAFKVSDGKNTLVYTSDISFAAKDIIIKFATDADLLICDSSLLEKHGLPEINSHITAKQAAIIANEANVKKLMLTHFWPLEIKTSYLKEASRIFENTVCAYEGDIIVIE